MYHPSTLGGWPRPTVRAPKPSSSPALATSKATSSHPPPTTSGSAASWIAAPGASVPSVLAAMAHSGKRNHHAPPASLLAETLQLSPLGSDADGWETVAF